MKPLLLACSLAILPLAAFAGEGTTVLLHTKAMSLKPGTKVRIEVRAEYALIEMPKVDPKLGPGMHSLDIAEENTRYRLASDNTVVWEFTVAADGSVPVKQFRLAFPKKLLGPPKGMIAEVGFPVKYTVQIPGSQPRVSQPRFGMPIESDAGPTIERCLRAKGGPDGGFGVGLVPTCDYDPVAHGGKMIRPK